MLVGTGGSKLDPTPVGNRSEPSRPDATSRPLSCFYN